MCEAFLEGDEELGGSESLDHSARPAHDLCCMRPKLPTGTVTFLFTDVEGSTRLLHEVGTEAYAAALAEHRRIVRDACIPEGGIEVDTQGDAFFVAFPTAIGAVAAAQAITRGLEPGPIRVRIGLHTGTPLLTNEGYVGADVHFAARVAASAHGGQVILSTASRDLLGERFLLTDLGEHRLKDIVQPVWIFQLGDEPFPPLKTISNTNLPRPPSSFVGRERELADVVSRIREGARLLTLTGPGGTGKTRLAIEAAATLVPDYQNGVFWVGLASLRDPALVLETVAQTLGAKQGLAEHLGHRQLLLVLDNLEHLIEVAAELSALLAVCPNLVILVTSRERLRVQGEVEYEVPPLADHEAVTLFCERAQVERSDEIRELCARLDNLPLAVELAAARVKALPPAHILERLASRLDLLKGGRDAIPRQQTLRATIDWSYELLAPREQRLFRAFSVFAGGSTYDAAAAVCDADLDTLQSLIEKSLLRRSGERFWMLETIREYARERLEGSDVAAELGDRHLAHYLATLSATGRDAQRAADREAWLAICDHERANLHVAFDHAVGTADREAALTLFDSVGPYWGMFGASEAAERWARLAMNLVDEGDLAGRAKILVQAGEYRRMAGDHRQALEMKAESMRLTRAAGGHPDREATLLDDMAGSLVMLGRLDEARAALEEALSIRRRRLAENPLGVSHTLFGLAALAIRERRLVDAKGIVEEINAIESGLELPIGWAEESQVLQAELLLAEGRPAEAAEIYRSALQHAAAIGYRVPMIEALMGMAAIEVLTDPLRAVLLLGMAEALQADSNLMVLDAQSVASVVAQAISRAGDQAVKRAHAQGRVTSIDRVVDAALAPHRWRRAPRYQRA